VSPDELRAEIARYGTGVREFFRTSHPPDLMSPLFNMPARLVVGSHCYFEHAPEILRRTAAAVPPEELGRRARTVGHRPNGLTLNSLMLGYLNGREQRRLTGRLDPDAPLPDERYEETATMVDFWRRFGRAYVDDERGAMTGELGDRLPILPPEAVAELAERARPVDDPAASVAVRRMMAVTQLYTFIQNGESRVGVHSHGPYPLGPGEVLVVKELVGLRDRFIDLEVDERPHLDTIVRVMRLRDVRASIDLFGSLGTDPFEYEDRVLAEAVLTVEGGRLRALSLDEVARVTETAGTAQIQAYARAAEWSTDERIAYGADLYASLIANFPRAAGLDLDDEIRSRFRECAARFVPGLRDGAEPPLVLARIAAPEGDVYSTALPEPG